MVPTSKSSTLYVCECCDYSSSRKSQYNRHLLTDKHKILQNPTIKSSKTNEYVCECGKTYKHMSTLYAHRKRCERRRTPHEPETITPDNKNIIMMLIKENTDLKHMIMKVIENGTNNNTITNSYNKSFNLNFFLNETCKNAMNITDFVESIKLQLNDLLEFGELGYVEGISKIIVNNLNNLDETERPIHCTDKKRETMYVKDEGEWNKEDEKKSKLKKAINRIADKNIRLLPIFREKYPDYNNSYSNVSDIHDKLVIEVMETDDFKKDKIIHNISKVTTIREK